MSGLKFGNLDALKKNRSAKMAELAKKASDLANDKGYTIDPRLWKPTFDASGVAKARVRFCDGADNGDGTTAPEFVRVYKHFFRGPGGVYAENCRTTLKGESDPAHEYARALWALKDPAKEQLARNVGRKEYYIANVYIVKDPGNPENEGKVFLWQFPKSVWKMLEAATNGKSEGDADLGVDSAEPVDVFSLYTGTDFVLNIHKKGQFPNYDKCQFVGEPYSIKKTDEELMKVWKSVHNLSEFLDPSKFKSYEELEKLLLRTLRIDSLSDVEVETTEEETLPGSKRQTRKAIEEDTDSTAESETSEDGGDDDGYISKYMSRKK
jgi:hypothetical protein